MFNKNFYPTPDSVLQMMDIDCEGKIILEPSAGKGNIIDYLKINGAKEVLSCEINKDLAEIVKAKSKFIGYDFLQVTAEQISHINSIIANPPFSNGATHLLHAWEIAPDGCEISFLLNWETINNSYSQDRRRLERLIEDYGTSINLGNVFSDSERKTDVSIGYVKLHKPNHSNNEFDGFFLEDEPQEQGENGIMPFNTIRDVVQRYVYSVKCFDEFSIISKKMNELNTLFNVGGFTFNIEHNKSVCTKEDYKKELQKKAWKYLFKKMNMDKYVTSGVMKDINSFVENQQNIPFTMKNIYKMFEIIVGTRQETFNRSIVEIIDKFTEHTHENRYNVEGWKTNLGHLLNKKIIVPYCVEKGWTNFLSPRYSQHQDKLQDLVKVLCNLMGKNYDELPSLYTYCREIKMQPNVWYNWDFEHIYGEGENKRIEKYDGFFEIKGFLKGTLHLKFKDEKVWSAINLAYGKIKGMSLPEKI